MRASVVGGGGGVGGELVRLLLAHPQVAVRPVVVDDPCGVRDPLTGAAPVRLAAG